ncbi:MAG: hypothetical protein P0107_00880, partial [Nitrosomonas sp.]|nr:hypothetical protein [Nitrosomonas sp.]
GLKHLGLVRGGGPSCYTIGSSTQDWQPIQEVWLNPPKEHATSVENSGATPCGRNRTSLSTNTGYLDL